MSGRPDDGAWQAFVSLHEQEVYETVLDSGLSPDDVELACRLAWLRLLERTGADRTRTRLKPLTASAVAQTAREECTRLRRQRLWEQARDQRWTG